MDFTSFCHSFFSETASRLPSGLLSESEATAMARQGGWYYPSARAKNAFYFNCHLAYQQFLSGLDPLHTADCAEDRFLKAQWHSLISGPCKESLQALTPQWGLCFRSREDIREPAAPYLQWHEYDLIPYCRFLNAADLAFRPVTEKDLWALHCSETEFWQRFWQEWQFQNPPRLYGLMPDQSLKPLRPESLSASSSPVYLEPLYILTGRLPLFGAAIVFYPGLLLRLHRHFSDYYIGFRSPHEALLFPRGRSDQKEIWEILKRPDRIGPGNSAALPPSLYQYTVERGLTIC